MRSIQKRLEDLETINRQEICCTILWVRRGCEEEDEKRQILELKEWCKDLPSETYYQMFGYGEPSETYEDFMQRLRKEITLDQWWKQYTIRGVPCRDYKEDWKKLKKL